MKYTITLITVILNFFIIFIKGQYDEYNTLYYYDIRDEFQNVDFDKDLFDDGIFIIDQYFDIVSWYFNSFYGLQYNRYNEPTYDVSGTYELIHDMNTFDAWTNPNGDNSFGQIGFALFGNKFETDAFFPVDDMGYGNNGDDHNYRWCVRMRFNARVHTNTTKIVMRVGHSDDLFIIKDSHDVLYANIGIQLANYGYFEIDYLKPGEYFDLDIINCNRKKRNGTHIFAIELFGFDLSCDWYDQCGICEGTDECVCDPDECVNEEYDCIGRSCTSFDTCTQTELDCSTLYPLPDNCTISYCTIGLGCGQQAKNCDDNNPCTTDTCDPVNGCEHTLIHERCERCNNQYYCLTDDPCYPNRCVVGNPSECTLTEYQCPNPDPCHSVECNSTSGSIECVYTDICDSSDSEIIIDSSELPEPSTTTYEPGTGEIETDTIGTTIATTTASTTGTTIATTTATTGPVTTTSEVTTGATTIESTTTSQSTTGSTVASTVGTTLATTTATTVASTISPTISTGEVTIAITATTLASTITTAATILTTTPSTLITTTPVSTTFSSTTHHPLPPTICLPSSCPEGYNCVELKQSYTCVPCYFTDHCDPFGNLLRQFY